MSFKRLNLVLADSKTKGPQRLLLTILAHHVNQNNDDGVCWPGYKLLSEEMGCDGDSTATVARVMGQLKKTGEIMISDGRGRTKHPYYLITLGMTEAEVRTTVDDYEKKGIKFDMFYWEKERENISGMIPFNEESEPNPKEKGIETDTLTPENISVLREKHINSDTSMLTKKNLNKKTTTNAREENQNLEFGQISTELKSNGFYLGSALANELNDLYDEIEPPPNETKLQWFAYAIKETMITANRPQWRLLRKILRDVGDTGSVVLHETNRSNRNGQNRTDSKKSKATGKTGQGKSGTSITDSYLKNNAENINRRLDELLLN